jgi:heptosyltransferase-1
VRVLIVLPGALGDVVRGLPLLGRLRRGWPAARIGWAVESPSAPLLERHPWIDVLHVLGRRAPVREVLAFLRAVRRERYDVALDLGRGLKSAAILRGSGAPRRVGLGPADGREGSWLMATERLAPGSHERRVADELLHGLAPPIVVASLGSSCASRRWWPEPTATVLDALVRRRGASAVLTGTGVDASFAAEVTAAMHVPVRNLVAKTSLRELTAVLARAGVVFGPDSGALHVAAALGVPVVSLWGPTSAARSTPWGQERGVIQGQASCAPCFLRACPIGRVCMRTIDAALVLERVETALGA